MRYFLLLCLLLTSNAFASRQFSTNYFFDIAKGNIAGHSILDKFGRNADIDSGAPEDVWDGGGDWVAPTAARIHNIVSTSALDAVANSGARTVRVYGLDAAWNHQEETVNMAGVAGVLTVNTYTMIYRMKTLTGGTDAGNVGVISAIAQVDGTTTAQISAGQNQTLMAVYMVPAGKTGYITSMGAALNRAGSANADVELWAKPFGGVWTIKHITGVDKQGTNAFHHIFTLPMRDDFVEKTLIKIRAGATANNTDISAHFDMILVDN